MKNEFPYTEYMTVIKAESELRNFGVEADIISIESDESRPGGFVLEVKLFGKMDDSCYECGSVISNGECIGSIVEINSHSGVFAVSLKRDLIPSVGTRIKFLPPDYLQPLREFSSELCSKPEIRNEGRFLGLRESLLKNCTAALKELPAVSYLRGPQRCSIQESARRDFSLLWGPPGTGKSYTLGHIAAYFRSLGKRVLVLSTTNAAVDVTTFAIDDACARIGSALSSAELIRYTSALTQLDEYEKRPHLMAFTKLLERYAKDQKKIDNELKSARAKLQSQVHGSVGYTSALLKVCALKEELRILGESRKSEIGQLVGSAKIICSSITTCLFNGFLAQNFDVVLVDEASQIPLAVWPMILNNAGDKKIVVAGDPLQLEPVRAKSKDINAQNWFGQNLYSYLGMTTMDGIRPFCTEGSMTLLNEQTRMRKGICEIVSKMFYDGLLIGDRKDVKMDFSAAGLPSEDVVLVDPDVGGELYGFNRFYKSNFPNTNTQSAGRVMEIVSRLVSTNPTGRKLDILIISPFRNQVYKVYASKLNSYKSNTDVTIRCSTVHSAQGDEADVVIFDLVNPSSPFIADQDASHLWCVACSRAKEKLLIVGDKEKMKYAYFPAYITHLLGHKRAA